MAHDKKDDDALIRELRLLSAQIASLAAAGLEAKAERKIGNYRDRLTSRARTIYEAGEARALAVERHVKRHPVESALMLLSAGFLGWSIFKNLR